MIPANLDPKVEIREKERQCFHVRMTYVVINQNDLAHPTNKVEVRSFRQRDYFHLFGGNTEKQIRNRKVIGCDTVELVHDPRLEVKDVIEVKHEKFVKTDQEKIDEGVKNELEKREAEQAAQAEARKQRKPRRK